MIYDMKLNSFDNCIYQRSTAIDSYFTQMTNPPTKVGWVGSGCSPATEPTAELTQYHNITQVCDYPPKKTIMCTFLTSSAVLCFHFP